MEVKKVVEKWEIWDEEEEVTRSEEEAKKLVPKEFHQWIKVFSKKQSEQMLMRKSIGPCDRDERGIYTKERKSVPVVKEGKRGSKRVYLRAAEEGVHLTVQVTPDSASILYREKGWKEADSTRLLIFK